MKSKKQNELQKLAKQLHYKLVFEDNNNEPLINDCSKAGDTIWIGQYDDKELELISFFHEHGHSLVTQRFIKQSNYNTLMIELEAWHLGIKFATKLGYLFSDEALKWAFNKAMSYVGHDEREYSNWNTTHKPKLWKYLTTGGRNDKNIKERK